MTENHIELIALILLVIERVLRYAGLAYPKGAQVIQKVALIDETALNVLRSALTSHPIQDLIDDEKTTKSVTVTKEIKTNAQ